MFVQLSKPLHALLIIPYSILLFVGLSIPSDGSHGLINIKSLAFLSTVFCSIAYLVLNQKFLLSQMKSLLFLFATSAFLFLWMSIGLFNEDFSAISTFDQFKVFFLTIAVIFLSLFLTEEKLISFQQILKIALWANLLYSSIKIALLALHLLKVINLWTVIETLGIRFMSMSIFGAVPRLQTSIDISTPFLLFFFLQSKKWNIHWSKPFAFFYITASFAAIFLSFSRYLIAVALLSLFLHFLTLRLLSMFKGFLLVLISLLTFVGLIGVDTTYKIVERRLFSSDNYVSDKTRIEQSEALWDEYSQHPWLGKGMGGYAKSRIRDSKLLHSYEVQWMAFLMQFGTIGILFILGCLAMIAFNILSFPLTRNKIALFLLFLSWLLSGFTNPFLISLTSGIMYTLFLIGGKEWQQYDNLPEERCITNPT